MSAFGIMVVDKPEGPTSHGVVSIVRRGTGVRKVGHAGTLDPRASGVLVLCLGPATRLSEYLSSSIMMIGSVSGHFQRPPVERKSSKTALRLRTTALT